MNAADILQHKKVWNRLHSEKYEGYTENPVDVINHIPSGFLREDWVVLEIGCGAGHVMERLAGKVKELHGIDISSEALLLAEKRLQRFDNVYFHEGLGDNLSMFLDNFFDFIYSIAVFQHIPKVFTMGYLRDCVRVLKPQRKLLFQVITRLNPIENIEDIGFIKSEETRGYSKDELVKMVIESGLKLMDITCQKLTRRGDQLAWFWVWSQK